MRLSSNLFSLFALIVPILVCGQQQTNPPAAKQPPNIIFILSDDHACQAISAYGSGLVETPHIDRLAKEGALFTHSWVTNSICGPSRATLLTGKYSHLNGFRTNGGNERFDSSQLIFPALLKQKGYQTAWIGKWHLNSLPRGLDHFQILNGQGEYYNPDLISDPNDTARYEGYVTDIITGLAEKWMDGRQQQPFCLVIGEKATHREWLPDIQDLGAYDDRDFPLPPTFFDDYAGRKAAAAQDMTIDKTMLLKADLKVHADYVHSSIYNRFTPAQKAPFYAYYEGRVSREFDSLHLGGKELARWKYERYLKDYFSVARSLDRNVGELLDYLDRTGLASNTVVIYCSDQGFYLGEHGWFDKRFMYNESLRTPFLIRYPGVIKPGTKIDQIMLNIDWAPTLLDIAGVKAPAEMQGESFLPLLKHGYKGTWRNAAYYHYYEYPQPHHVCPHFGIGTQRYKLIRFYSALDSWELFDLKNDPHELHNLYSDPAYAKTADTLKKQLLELAKHYKDEEAVKILAGRP